MDNEPAEVISFRRYLKRRAYAPNTIRCYLNDLAHFLQFVAKPVGQVMPQDVDRYIEAQQERGLAATTINRRLSAVRQLYTYLRRREAPGLVRPVRPDHALRTPRPLPRFLKADEVERLFAAIQDRRDRAMFTLMLHCGLRVREVARLEMHDLDLAGQRLTVRDSKNRKDRVVFLSLDALQILEAYLAERSLIPEGRLHELRFEDLEQDMLGQVRAIYDHLELEDFQQVEPKLSQYIDSMSSYKKNLHDPLPDELKRHLAEAWGPMFDAFGYDPS